jgi:hypothetical protein
VLTSRGLRSGTAERAAHRHSGWPVAGTTRILLRDDYLRIALSFGVSMTSPTMALERLGSR